MRNLLIILSVLFLTSCDHIEEDSKVAEKQIKEDAQNVGNNVSKNASRVADNVRDSIKRTNNRIREWWITPLPVAKKHPMPTRYCYRVLQDIVCYREQREGWESKLVGYQGENAEPPRPATMKVMALRPENPDANPAVRAAKAKPVFASIPENDKDKKDKGSSSEAISIDASQETISDSPLSPQL